MNCRVDGFWNNTPLPPHSSIRDLASLAAELRWNELLSTGCGIGLRPIVAFAVIDSAASLMIAHLITAKIYC